jgi:hypothetical protein
MSLNASEAKPTTTTANETHSAPHAIAHDNSTGCSNPSSAPYPKEVQPHVAVAVPPRQVCNASHNRNRPTFTCELVTAVVVDLIFWVLVAVLIVSAVGGLGLDDTYKPLVFMFVGVFTFLLYLMHWSFACGTSIAAQLGAESVDSMDSLETYVAHTVLFDGGCRRNHGFRLG